MCKRSSKRSFPPNFGFKIKNVQLPAHFVVDGKQFTFWWSREESERYGLTVQCHSGTAPSPPWLSSLPSACPSVSSSRFCCSSGEPGPRGLVLASVLVVLGRSLTVCLPLTLSMFLGRREALGIAFQNFYCGIWSYWLLQLHHWIFASLRGFGSGIR